MISIIKPFGIGKVADRVKDIFKDTGLSYHHICCFITMFLFGFKSVSELVRHCGWCSSPSALSRALLKFVVKEPHQTWPQDTPTIGEGTDQTSISSSSVIQNRFMRRLRSSIKRKFKNINAADFVLALDDTGNPKYGLNHPGTGMWANSSGGKYHGQKILVLALINLQTKQAYPLSYAFLQKKDKKAKELEHETAHQIGIKLLQNILDEGFPRLPLVADSWFSSNQMILSLQEMKIVFVSELKSNRNLKINISPRVKYKKSSEIFKSEVKIETTTKRKYPSKIKESNVRYHSHKILFLKGDNHPYSVVAVYNKKNDVDPFAVYLATDIQKSGEWIWSIARARWSIEVMFRDLKQNLSFGRMPSVCKDGSDLSVCIPFILYTILCLEGGYFFGVKDSQSCPIGTLVKKIREMSFAKSLDILTLNPLHPSVQTLKSRRSLHRVNKKPVNKPSEALAA